jgi:hypothetical protein
MGSSRHGGSRGSGRWRTVVILAVGVALVTGGCTTGTATPNPAGSIAPAPTASPAGSPAGGSSSPDLSSVQDLLAPITSLTWSEDPTSAFAAVAELGPNSTNLARIELYRGADGSIETVVGYDTKGRVVALSLDADGRLVRASAGDGTRLEARYAPDQVEVTVTFPDGTVDRETGPVQAARAPSPQVIPARLVAFTTAAALVDVPQEVYTSALVELKATRTDGKPLAPGSVLYSDATCVSSDPDVECLATVEPSPGGATVTITNIVAAPTPAAGAPQVWRTRADCDAAKGQRLTSWRAAGSLLAVILAARTIATRTARGARPSLLDMTTAVAVGTLVLSQSISWGPPLTAENCATAPNLEQLRDDLLDAKVLATVKVSARAEPATTCAESSTDGLRIKEPVGDVTLSPFTRANRSSDYLGTRGEFWSATFAGSIAFQAAPCAVEMEGTIDLAATAAAMGMPAENASDWVKLFTVNRILLEMTPNAESAAPLDVTGTFTLEQTNPSCTASTRTTTQTTTGDLRGTATYAGGYLVEGLATIKSAHSEGSCAAPEAPMTAPWSAAGDESTLQGAIEIPGRNGVPGGTIIFTVKAKP